MMVLVTHQLQGSCSSFPSVPSSWSRGIKLKQILPAFHPVGRRDRLISLKCRSCSSGGASLGPKSKIFKISAFKGGSRHDDSSGRGNGLKSLKNPVKVSYLQHKSEESSKVEPAPYLAADGITTRSLAIQKLFKNWLILLHTPSRTQPLDGALKESSVETSEKQNTMKKQERGEILKAVWRSFLALDATIKIPVVMFMPLYLAVNLVYGSEVSKELTPLWILGPLIVGFYIKMFRAMCSLYIFSFKQTVKTVKNLPSYFSLAYEYIFRGKLNEAIHIYLWQLLVDLKNMDYKDVARVKLKDLQEWLVERCLDFVESIWPYYCRTIRFLKRANLI